MASLIYLDQSSPHDPFGCFIVSQAMLRDESLVTKRRSIQ